MSQKIIHLARCISLISCFILFQQVLIAQNINTLKGRVYDSTTNAPLPFATVRIFNSSAGVITNEFGEFTFHIPDNLNTSNVQISYIGYKKINLEATSIKPDTIYSFGMVPEVKVLNEVNISGYNLPPSDIVKRAIENISKNYPREEFLLHGYYRDYIKDKSTEDYKNLTEAAVIIEDRGFNKNDYAKSKIKLEQIRYNPGFIVDTLLSSVYDGKTKYIPYALIEGENELAMLRLQDPIRNHNIKTFSFVDILDRSFIPNHTFRYESIINNDSSKIFEISFETQRFNYSNDEYSANGKIYILAQNYAILKFTYTLNCKWPTYSGKVLDFKLEYKNYMDKYYLSYLSSSNYFEYKTKATDGSRSKKYFQYRELFINKIDVKHFESIKPQETIRKDVPLLSNKIPVKEGLWDNYNYISNVKFNE